MKKRLLMMLAICFVFVIAFPVMSSAAGNNGGACGYTCPVGATVRMAPGQVGQITSQHQLQAALNAAQSGTKVVLNGDITLSSALIWPNKNDITLDGNGYTLSLAKGYSGRHIVAELTGGNKLTITNLNLVGLNAPNQPPTANAQASRTTGGGMELGGEENTHFELSYMTITDCHAENGGAVYLRTKGMLHMADVDANRNSAEQSGGAVCALDSMPNSELANCDFNGNVAMQGDGGAVAMASRKTQHNAYGVVVANCNFVGNMAPNGIGGALRYTPGENHNIQSLRIANGSFSSNMAQDGGAISINGPVVRYNKATSPWTVLGLTLQIEHTRFSGNAAANGGVYWDIYTPRGVESNDPFEREQVGIAQWQPWFVRQGSISQDAAGELPVFNNVFNNHDVQFGGSFNIYANSGGAVWKATGNASDVTVENVASGATWGSLRPALEGDLQPKLGYKLVGWYIDAGKTLGVAADIKLNDSYRFYGPAYVKAVWEEAGSITYHSNNGSGDSYAQTPLELSENTQLLGIDDIEGWQTQQGKVFVGWGKTAQPQENETIYEPGQNYLVEGNSELYARWGDACYDVVFNSNGGTQVGTYKAVKHGNVITAPEPPTKEGYEFAGWYVDGEFSKQWNFSVDAVTANITLHAKWNEIGQQPNSSSQMENSSSGASQPNSSSGAISSQVASSSQVSSEPSYEGTSSSSSSSTRSDGSASVASQPNSAASANSSASSMGQTSAPGGNSQPGNGNSQPSGGNSQPGGGNSLPSGGNSQPGGGNSQPNGGNSQPSGGISQQQNNSRPSAVEGGGTSQRQESSNVIATQGNSGHAEEIREVGAEGERHSPLVQSPGNSGAKWSLVNLIAMLSSIVVAVFVFASALVGSGEPEEEDYYYDSEVEEKEPKRGYLWRTICMIAGLGGVVLFFVTQNLRLPMGLVDKWTPVMAGLLVVQAITVFAARYVAKNTALEEE